MWLDWKTNRILQVLTCRPDRFPGDRAASFYPGALEEQMQKIITFASAKGGVGKSTSAVSLAMIIAEKSPTLYIDLAHNNSGTSHFISDLSSVRGKTIHQCLLGNAEIRDCAVSFGQFGRLSVLASEPEMALIDIELAGRPNQFFSMFEMLQDVREDYDYVVLDTPGHVGVSLRAAVIASDIVIIPTQLETWSAREVGVTLQIIQDSLRSQKYIGKAYERIGILPTFWEENRTVKAQVLEVLLEIYGESVAPVPIHTSSIVSKTYAAALGRLPENSRPFAEYSELAAWLGVYNGR